jgi:MFS transporter, DHA2 family, multidrug resistance protein
VAWRLAVLGVGNGLVTGPVNALILAATPPGMAATAGGVSALFRTLGLSLGPAAGALAWTVTGAGLAGFRAGVAVITATTLAGLAAIAGLWLHGRRHPVPLERPETALTG